MKKQEVLIVTNNPLVKEKIEENYNIDFVDGGILDVMEKLRNMIHKGSVLLTHPLSGSIKPGQTPYKSVMIHIVEGSVDADSLFMIEYDIDNCKKFVKRVDEFREGTDEDKRFIDYTLILSGIESFETLKWYCNYKRIRKTLRYGLIGNGILFLFSENL